MMEQRDDRRILFLFRHGETDWNREGRLQGHTDTPLNATGLAQAEALAETLRPHRLDAVVSSDLMRAWTTARIVAGALGLPLLADPGLRETNVGAAEGLLEAIGIPFSGGTHSHHERCVTTTRAALGEEAFAAAWVSRHGNDLRKPSAVHSPSGGHRGAPSGNS